LPPVSSKTTVSGPSAFIDTISFSSDFAADLEFSPR